MSGTGKSTLAREFKKRGFPVFDMDSMGANCDWINNETGQVAEYVHGVGKEWLLAHNWNCDLEKIKKAVMSSADADTVMVVGIIGNQRKMINFFDKVFLLRLDSETLKHRLMTRTTNDFANNEKDQEFIFEIKDEFEQEMIDLGATPLDGNLPTATIADQIIELVK
jgi:dephospho-CoA kinase